MTTDLRRSIHWPSITLLFLMLAYPLTFFSFYGGRYCGPLCFTPTPIGIAILVVGVFVLLLIAGGISTGLRLGRKRGDGIASRWLGSPPRSTGFVLFGLFGIFVAFLILDTLSLYEAIWKPVVLPISFLLFLPVWVLYMITFPLSVVLSIAGIPLSPVVTLVSRGVVLAVGFPLSALFQMLVVSAVLSGFISEK